MGDATEVDGWADCFSGIEAALAIATEGDSFHFDGEERGDFDKGELGPLGKVSNEVESQRSLVGLTTLVFCLIPCGTDDGREDGFVASVVTEEATGCSRRQRRRRLTPWMFQDGGHHLWVVGGAFSLKHHRSNSSPLLLV